MPRLLLIIVLLCCARFAHAAHDVGDALREERASLFLLFLAPHRAPGRPRGAGAATSLTVASTADKCRRHGGGAAVAS